MAAHEGMHLRYGGSQRLCKAAAKNWYMVQPLPNSILLLLISEFAGLPLTCLVLSRGVSRMLVLRKVNETKNDREKTGIIIIKNNIIYRCISTN